jgi:Flp pilus assembly protein TadG
VSATCTTGDEAVRHTAIRFIQRLRSSSEGVNLVEAALVLPIMLLTMFGLMEFAIILYVQMALQNGISQATRYGITRQTFLDKTREESIIAVMKRETPTLSLSDGNFTFQNKPLSGGSWTAGTGGENTLERVTVTYDYPIMTPILRPFFSGDVITLEAEATMKNESDPEP